MKEKQKWPSHLVLVRHAESERNVAKPLADRSGDLEYGGGLRHVDVDITALGQEQAEATGRYLGRQFSFDRVFASPLRRTLHTAELLIGQFPHRVPLIHEERVREIEFGILDGLTKKGIGERYPIEAERRETLGKYWYRPPGGESWPDVALRLHSFIGTLNRDCRGESVLVVCHSVVVLLFRRLLERLSEAEILAIDKTEDVANCSITHYAFDANLGANGKLVLREFNLIVYDQQMLTAETPKTETV